MTSSRLQDYRDTELGLAELVRVSAELLAGHQPADRRVAPRPDARTVRYYQSLGIVDRPTYRGRSAVYAYRQLVQVLATKLLQGQGHSLAEVQSSLSGRSTDQLAAAAAQALGQAAPAPTPLSAPTGSPPSPRALVAVELAEGITVSIDPRAVSDVDATIRRLMAALAPGGTHDDLD